MTQSVLPPSRTAADFKGLRERLGLPARWLANDLGVLDRQVRRWEQGAAEIPSSAWASLVDIYGQSVVSEQAVLDHVRDHPHWPVYAPRNDSELWRGVPGFKNTTLPASHYRAILARVAAEKGISLHYNPEPLPESVISGRPELRGQNLDKFYPAFMEGGPFNDRELSIEYGPPHPRMPFGKLPFTSAAPGAPSYHYELVPESVMLSASGYDVIECRYTFAGYNQ